MRKDQQHNLPVMRKDRRELRKNQTPAEKVLWSALRNRNLCGLKFRRQHSIGCFVVDFYCSEKKLIVEVDGKIHLQKEVAEYDNERTADLQSMGFSLVRFKNEEVLSDLNKVLDAIINYLTPACPAGRPDPSPNNRRGEKSTNNNA